MVLKSSGSCSSSCCCCCCCCCSCCSCSCSSSSSMISSTLPNFWYQRQPHPKLPAWNPCVRRRG
ncbi:unnamed protein product, partial [Vitis vinifera]